MASILVLSNTGDGVDLGNRLVQEGHIVKMWFRDYPHQMSSNPSRILTPAMLDQYDIILGASDGIGDVIDDIRDERLVVGGGKVSDRMFEDEVFCKNVLRQTCTTIQMEGFDERMPEVTTEGWFNGETFSMLNHSFIYRRLMDRDKGIRTPFMGSIGMWAEEDELVERCLLPLIPMLKMSGYIGPVSMSVGVEEGNLFIIDFQMGLRYDIIQGMVELFSKGLFDMLLKFRMGVEIEKRNEYFCSVRLSLPPYPFPVGTQVHDVRLEYPKEAERHVFQKMPDRSCVLGCCTSRADNFRELRRRVYRTISNCVKNPEVIFREDIGVGIEERIHAVGI